MGKYERSIQLALDYSGNEPGIGVAHPGGLLAAPPAPRALCSVSKAGEFMAADCSDWLGPASLPESV